MDLQSPDSQKRLDALKTFRKLLSIQTDPPINEIIATGNRSQICSIPYLHRRATLAVRSCLGIGEAEGKSLLFFFSHQFFFFSFLFFSKQRDKQTNIASGTTDNTRFVVDLGTVPLFVNLLNSPNEDVRNQSIWALGNIAGDSPYYRDVVLRHFALPLLVKVIDDDSTIPTLRNITWAISNLCRYFVLFCFSSFLSLVFLPSPFSSCMQKFPH